MFTKSSKPLTLADITDLEETLGTRLPADFTNLYLHANGGVADKSYYYVEEDEGFVEVSFFIPINYPSDELGNLDVLNSYLKLTDKGIPKRYLPFAVDWGGNYFAIDLETNEVVLLLMDLGEFTDSSVKHLSSCFLNFINELEEEGDEEC